jgi:putative membrane protein
MSGVVAWTLVFHIVGIVFWMAGLLIATVVMAAHADTARPETRETLVSIEKKLVNGFMHPGAVLAIAAGVALLFVEPLYLHSRWLHLKLLLVAGLLALDVVVYLRGQALEAGQLGLRRAQFMMLHGLSSLLFLGIVVLVVIKPF